MSLCPFYVSRSFFTCLPFSLSLSLSLFVAFFRCFLSEIPKEKASRIGASSTKTSTPRNERVSFQRVAFNSADLDILVCCRFFRGIFVFYRRRDALKS